MNGDVKWNFDELMRLGREAGASLHADDTPGQVQRAAALLKTAASARSAVSGNPLVSLQIMAQTAGDVHRVAETERTRRAEIASERDLTLARLEATRVLLHEYMTRTFDERRATLDAMFSSLDRAQDNGDSGAIQQLLGGIVDIVKSSPFKDLAEFRRRYDDPNFTLEL